MNQNETPHSAFESRPSLSQLINWTHERYPKLKDVSVKLNPNKYFQGGRFNLPPEHDLAHPEVEISEHLDTFELLKQTRPFAIKIMAEQLGIDVDSVDAVTIQQFIFFHEMGHIYEFMETYLGDGADSEMAEASVRLQQESDSQLMQLPLKGITPAEICEAVDEADSFDVWRTQDEEIAVWCEEQNIVNLEQLIEIQERAYRALPKEVFADMFAVKSIKEIEKQF